MEKTYHFKGLLTEQGWLTHTKVTLDTNGKITSITPNAEPEGETVSGYALPGFQNAHSHAFQYAMAGLAELHEGSGVPDDFWSWRNAMYDLALTISPDDLEAIATQLYAEMVRHGYTAVTEFHYLHHQPDGSPYENLAEMGLRLIKAAKKAGIHITLVPMFYQKGGFGQAPTDKQRRFLSPTLEDYLALVDSTKEACKTYDNATYGMGVHSLRAVAKEDIVALCEQVPDSIPFHIHVSEQLKEIEDCQAFYGKRPVQWLLDTVQVKPNFHLVHATHLDDSEVKGIAASGAHVVLCPTTEGNLGDGLFRFNDFKALGGKWSIGTDSHIGINPLEELRLLDYGQRLITHKRTTFYTSESGDSAFNALKMSYTSGRKAMGLPSDHFFAIGDYFDAAVFDANHPLVATASPKNLCNTLLYTQDVSKLVGTLKNGRWMVKNNLHHQGPIIGAKFIITLKLLKTRE
ncbi:formimidoylglutamate deiminase [Pustulibacterium marinum]|uniref:Formimidoylglutamate deiminase n=1 Tax=Pustulibacterium marinum TaxID=1224947 RepID=A0A1I7GBC7_9FLAO|nr:formimidoylglutamate deiminase [Pustulibacterium marinum]SFU45759.1 formimidoylglutamate deiminase [Pustulibacterium marinum]